MIRIDIEARRGDYRLALALDTEARVSGLFGPTGSGKTTALMALAGLLTPERGRIEVGGTVLFDSARNVNVPPERRRVGMVFQDGRLFPHLTVEENLRFPRPSAATRGPAFAEVVELLDLGGLLDRRPARISGGQARLVAVGRALLARPRLLLLDEPLTGLDADLRRRVLAYLLRLRESVDVRMLLVSHVYADFLALVEEMGVLGPGKLTAVGTPEELMALALGTAGSGRVETTLTGRIRFVDGERALVACGGAQIELFLDGAQPGQGACLTVGADEVLIGAGEPPRTTARNTLAGRVAAVHRMGSRTLVAVDVGCLIWSEITERSTEELGIAPGSEVYLLIKASAVRGVVTGPGATG